VPSVVEFTSELPHTPTGKLARRRLRTTSPADPRTSPRPAG
jgi:acyl-coenzyme A synthetase/AMP-(fatty) acid ligase